MRPILLFLALILAGCADYNPSQNSDDKLTWKEMSEWENFSIQSPVSFENRIVRHDGSVALITFNTVTAERKPTDLSVYIYPEVNGACSVSITGSSKMSKFKDYSEKIQWGKVDVWEQRKIEGWEAPYPLSKVLCQESMPHTYILCSEKNSETVVICLNQITDNPDLAKQIFETFRWTE
jgi:hypothetical protein